MILTQNGKELGKSDAVYYLLKSMDEPYSKYVLNIWDMKNQDNTIDLARVKEIRFFEDAIILISKKGDAMFYNLNHIMCIDLVRKEGNRCYFR